MQHGALLLWGISDATGTWASGRRRPVVPSGLPCWRRHRSAITLCTKLRALISSHHYCNYFYPHFPFMKQFLGFCTWDNVFAFCLNIFAETWLLTGHLYFLKFTMAISVSRRQGPGANCSALHISVYLKWLAIRKFSLYPNVVKLTVPLRTSKLYLIHSFQYPSRKTILFCCVVPSVLRAVSCTPKKPDRCSLTSFYYSRQWISRTCSHSFP
jgi:hypothetical protein